MSYQINLEKFQGPLHLLCQLIEQEELDITEVSLAQVTDQYMSYLSRVEEINPEEVADFLVIAAKLLFIKSRLLLPSLQLTDEDESVDLERQLKIYRQFLLASRVIEERWLARQYAYLRPKPLLLAPLTRFLPPPQLNAQKLADTLFKVISSLEPIIKLPEVSFRKAVSIREKIEKLRQLIKQKIQTDWQSFIGGTTDKTEIIVSFLALLELVKQRQLNVEQSDLFGNITIHQA